MPKADEPADSSNDPWSLRGDRDFLEYGQRHGLLEDERIVSGGKRICFCYGYTLRVIDHNCWSLFLTLMYPLMFLFGFYSCYVSNCDCDGS